MRYFTGAVYRNERGIGQGWVSDPIESGDEALEKYRSISHESGLLGVVCFSVPEEFFNLPDWDLDAFYEARRIVELFELGDGIGLIEFEILGGATNKQIRALSRIKTALELVPLSIH